MKAMVSERDVFDEWAKKWDDDNYRKIRAYNQKFISYILRKANNEV
jgi:fibrillarin-like rRNA methylase